LETANAWIGAVVSPATAWDDLGRLYGYYPMVGANGIGTTGAVLTLVGISRLLWRDRRGSSRAWYWAVIVYGVASMAASRTRHSFASFLVGLLVILVLAKRKWIGLALMGAPLGTFVVEYMRRGQSDEDLRGLSSRMDFWQYAWQQLAQHPLTGLGAYAGGRFGVLEKLGRSDAAALHSDWAEIMTGTSFWGTLAMLLAVIGTLWFLCKGASSRRLSPLERDLSVECAGVMAMLTLHSFFNNEFTWHSPLYFLALVGYAELVRRKVRTDESAAPSRVAVGAKLSTPSFQSPS
jgi:O-antigen ligase